VWIIGGNKREAYQEYVPSGLSEALHSTALAYQIPLYGNLGIAAYSRYMTGYRVRRPPVSTFEV
jgi:hypothetical protein